MGSECVTGLVGFAGGLVRRLVLRDEVIDGARHGVVVCPAVDDRQVLAQLP